MQTLEEAVEQAVAQRVEAERKVLEAEYHQSLMPETDLIPFQ